MPVVALEHVTRRYHIGSDTVTALDDVTLSVEAGEFTVVLGPSGSGKTTILNMIGALDVPTSGRVVIDGRDITGASRRELFAYRRATVAFIFQTFNLFPGLTALENVEFGIDVAHGKHDRHAADKVLRDVGLGDRLTSPTSCRAASNNVSPSHAHSRPAAACCSPTSRPVSSTTERESRSSSCCASRPERARA